MNLSIIPLSHRILLWCHHAELVACSLHVDSMPSPVLNLKKNFNKSPEPTQQFKLIANNIQAACFSEIGDIISLQLKSTHIRMHNQNHYSNCVKRDSHPRRFRTKQLYLYLKQRWWLFTILLKQSKDLHYHLKLYNICPTPLKQPCKPLSTGLKIISTSSSQFDPSH